MSEEKQRMDLDDLLVLVEEQTLYLKEKAQGLVDDFSTQHSSGNKLHKKDRSFLFCRCSSKGNSTYIEWYFNFWKIGMKGKPLSTYLKRPERGYGYTMDVLLKHSAPWEYEIVKHTEQIFASLRKQNFHLAKARFQLREALKAEIASESFDEE